MSFHKWQLSTQDVLEKGVEWGTQTSESLCSGLSLVLGTGMKVQHGGGHAQKDQPARVQADLLGWGDKRR